jgi:hypothetical protein
VPFSGNSFGSGLLGASHPSPPRPPPGADVDSERHLGAVLSGEVRPPQWLCEVLIYAAQGRLTLFHKGFFLRISHLWPGAGEGVNAVPLVLALAPARSWLRPVGRGWELVVLLGLRVVLPTVVEPEERCQGAHGGAQHRGNER